VEKKVSADVALYIYREQWRHVVELEFVLKSLSFITNRSLFAYQENLNARNLKIGRAKEVTRHGPCSVAKLGLVGVCRSLNKNHQCIGKNLVDLVAGSVEV